MNQHPSVVYESRLVNDTLQQVNHQLTNFSLNGSSNISKKRMFQVRRTFLLIITFDLIFMGLLWILYNQIFNATVDKAFEAEVIRYSINNSTFDIVVVSGLRFIFLMIPYALLKCSHWIFVVFTTLSSTGFILTKVFIYTINSTIGKSAIYILLIPSCIIAGIEIWFYDYRVLPYERRLKDSQNQNERRPLLNSIGNGSMSPTIPIVSNDQTATISNQRHQSFYSPLHSLDNSDTEEISEQERRNVRSNSNISQLILETSTSIAIVDNNEAYEKQAEEMFDDICEIYNDNNSWREESKSKDGLDIVISKNFSKWGKIFRLTSTITGSSTDIVQILFERQEDIPKWSSFVNDCRILEVINNNLYITYQLTNEQAQGFISKRDFVNIVARRYIGDIVILAAQACVYSQMPLKENCVRAENGLTAYIIEKIDESTCKFTWILNVDLKGWIPQYLINSSLANIQLHLVESLRNYIFKTIDAVSSCSSLTDDNTV